MDIIFYLTTLLQTKKTVGIVGLGTFYRKKSPGKYDAAQHAFVPPSYTLAFDSEVSETEELAYFISVERNITIDSANYYIGEFAEKIQAQLADHQEADLGELGQLKLVNDEIIFLAAQDGNFGKESFGLPILPELETEGLGAEKTPIAEEAQLAAVEEENKLEEENPGQETGDIFLQDDQQTYDEITEVTDPAQTQETVNIDPPTIETIENLEEIPVTQTVAATAPEPTTIEEPIEEEFFEEEEPKKRTSFWVKFLVVLLIIVAAGAIAYFINPKFFDQYIQQNFEGKPATNVPTVPNDSLKTKMDSNNVDSVAKNNDMVTLVKDSTVIDSTKKYYEVISSSESTRKAADGYIKRVATIGIKASIADMPGKRYKVSVGTFTYEKPALARRDSLRILLKNKEIYIQPITPKKPNK
jgi:nucleoid DNA-binding protein